MKNESKARSWVRGVAAAFVGVTAAVTFAVAGGHQAPKPSAPVAHSASDGVSPLVRADMPRPEPLWRADNYRHNWWRAADVPADSPRPELRAVTTVGPPADWMLRRILEYARLHPRDPRLPEALFRAVRAGRLGESGPQTQKLQRAGRAFADRHFPGDPLTARIVW